MGELDREVDMLATADSRPGQQQAARSRRGNGQSRPAGATSKRSSVSGGAAGSLRRRKSKTYDLKATAAPLLATVGVLLLIPGIWSVLLLMGVGVPGSQRQDARPMAAVMLVSWPIALFLIAAAVSFFVQVSREKKQLAGNLKK